MRLDTTTDLLPDPPDPRRSPRRCPLPLRHDGLSPRIAFDDVGVSRPLDRPVRVFLPGWCGPRLFGIRLAAQPIGRRALAIDLRGHGASASGPGDFGYPELLDAPACARRRGRPTGHSGRRCTPGGRPSICAAAWPSRVPRRVLLDWMVPGPPPPFAAALAGLQHPAAGARCVTACSRCGPRASRRPLSSAGFIEEMRRHRRADVGACRPRDRRRFAASPAARRARVGAVPRPRCTSTRSPRTPRCSRRRRPTRPPTPGSRSSATASSHFPMFEVLREMVAGSRRSRRRRGARPASVHIDGVRSGRQAEVLQLFALSPGGPGRGDRTGLSFFPRPEARGPRPLTRSVSRLRPAPQ